MKLKKTILIGSILSTILFSACGSSNSTTNLTKDVNSTDDTSPTMETNATTDMNSTARFMSMAMAKQIIMQDIDTGLEWVNGREDDSVATGCFPMGPGFTEERAQEDADNFCMNLDFATHTDWRLATDLEIQKYTVDMDTAGLTPFYANPACPRVIGKNMDGKIRTINTHNTPPIGTLKDWESLNAGVRCVRVFEDDNSTMDNNTTDNMSTMNTMG